MKRKPITEQLENIAAEICEGYCKFPLMIKNQDQLDDVCIACPLNKLFDFELKECSEKTVINDKTVKHYLIEQGKSQQWLLEELKKKLPNLKSDTSYIFKVLKGGHKSPKIIGAIKEIMAGR